MRLWLQAPVHKALAVTVSWLMGERSSKSVYVPRLIFIKFHDNSINNTWSQWKTNRQTNTNTNTQTDTQTDRQRDREIQTSCSRVTYKWRGFQLRQVIHVLSLWTPGRLWPNVRPICSPEKGSHTHIYATQAHFYGAYLHCLSLQFFLILSNFTPSW